MVYDNEMHIKVCDMSKKMFDFSNKTAFFTKTFPSLDCNGQAEALSDFLRCPKYFFHYLNSNGVPIDDIRSEMEKGILEFARTGDRKLLPHLFAYFNVDSTKFDDAFLFEAFNKLCNTYDSNTDNKDKSFRNVLMAFVKSLSYSMSDENEYMVIRKSRSFRVVEGLICKYLSSLSDEEMLDDNIVSLLIDCRKSLRSKRIVQKLKGRFPDVSLEQYREYLAEMKQLDFSLVEEFCKNVKKYRINNMQLPYHVCVYLMRFFATDFTLLRNANIDLLKRYLAENGVGNAVVMYDEFVSRYDAKGISDYNVLSVADANLNLSSFCEAVRVVQLNDEKMDKNYTGLRYAMLKDRILKEKLSSENFSRNRSRFLFEIEAEMEGTRAFYEVLDSMGYLSGNNKAKYSSLDDEAKFRYSLAHFLNIAGVDYEKGKLFDDFVSMYPELIERYPVLKIEYNLDGSRKSVVEILKQLEYEIRIGKRTCAEAIDISSIIFGEYFVVHDAREALEGLRDYVPEQKAVLQLENELAGELSDFLKNQNPSYIVKRKEEVV